MKKLLILLTVFFSFVSCSNSNDNDSGPVELVGTWLLIEQYSDPGDGSGDYTTVNSDKTITFLAGGTIVSNGNLCSMDTNSGEDTSGTFDALENVINPNGCFSSNYSLTYELKQSENRLYIYYPCIEGCGQNFRKVN
jgi:hypothetical protein